MNKFSIKITQSDFVTPSAICKILRPSSKKNSAKKELNNRLGKGFLLIRFDHESRLTEAATEFSCVFLSSRPPSFTHHATWHSICQGGPGKMLKEQRGREGVVVTYVKDLGIRVAKYVGHHSNMLCAATPIIMGTVVFFSFFPDKLWQFKMRTRAQ